jgi:hypothetical protein
MPLTLTQRVATILGQSSVAVSHTGNTDETALATVTIPAGAMGANGRIRVEALWSYPNSANNKTCRVRFGGLAGTAIHSAVNTASLAYKAMTEGGNRNAANSQVWPPSTLNVGASGGAPVTGAIDTAAAVSLVITGQLASAAETIVLESYLVELLSQS